MGVGAVHDWAGVSLGGMAALRPNNMYTAHHTRGRINHDPDFVFRHPRLLADRRCDARWNTPRCKCPSSGNVKQYEIETL